MGSVFHYTDPQGALGILSSQSLFASDSRYLNDSSECAIINELIQPIFQAEIGEITRKLIEAGYLKSTYYEEFGVRGDQLQADALFRSIAITADNVSPRFVLSFCRHEESSEQYQHGLLSQWRGYADRGGIAIEFDEEEIKSALKIEEESFVYGAFDARNVLYKDFDKIFNSSDYEGLAGAMIARLFKDDRVKKITGDKNIDEALARYLSTAPFLKHFGFHEEREFRVAAACVLADKVPKGSKGLPKAVEFRSRNGLIIPFIRFFAADEQKLPIKAIVLGPHPRQELLKVAIDMILREKGIKVPFRVSEIPFRI